ncbi:DUF3052 domain-containing protein [Streptomyces sp. NPDC059985]|uniref:DUF3052 domain-containing protein n=1 Tax=Streptomyces sp. NPDC059985 TaxID=3347025 RepID=UPI00368808D3
MSAAAEETQSDRSLAQQLGFTQGKTAAEIGHDEDCDERLRSSIEAVTGSKLAAADSDDAADVVVLWWRDGDGDLVDGLAGAMESLDGDGHIWLLTPKDGRNGHVTSSEINEFALAAGLNTTSPVSAAGDWTGTRLLAPKAK